MTSTLIISNALLWLAVMGLGLLVLSLARQIGEMQEQFSPGAPLMMAKGLQTGEAAPQFDIETLDGRSVGIGKQNSEGRNTLLYFTSPDCPICATLLGTIKEEAETDPGLEAIVIGRGSADAHRQYRQRKADIAESLPWVVSDEVVSAFGIERLPYVVLADDQGNIVSHGLVNTREQLQSLCEAARETSRPIEVSDDIPSS